MSWGPKITLSGLNTLLSEVTNVDIDYQTSGHYTEWITLNPYEQAHVQVGVAFGATGNDTYFRTVATLDDTPNWSGDNIAFTAGSVGFVASSIQIRSTIVTGPYTFRLEFRKGGAIAGSYTPNAYVRKNGVSV